MNNLHKITYTFYIITNAYRTVLYCGVTNNLVQRLVEHYLMKGTDDSFAGKYCCHWLVYYEDFRYINDAIAREKEVKKWGRGKKEKLIRNFNPEWKFLNVEVCGQWPPQDLFHRKDL